MTGDGRDGTGSGEPDRAQPRHRAAEEADADVEASTERLNERLGPVRQTIRSPEEIGRFFDGLELTEPGLVQLP